MEFKEGDVVEVIDIHLDDAFYNDRDYLTRNLLICGPNVKSSHIVEGYYQGDFCFYNRPTDWIPLIAVKIDYYFENEDIDKSKFNSLTQRT